VPDGKSEGAARALSQTRFILAYTGKLVLTECSKINDLAPWPSPKMAQKNAYTSSLRQNREEPRCNRSNTIPAQVPHCDVPITLPVEGHIFTR
jgi:hypothetical protein